MPTRFLVRRSRPSSCSLLTAPPGCMVVNIGDMLEIWTNGLWKSTKHRVVHRAEKLRVSVPFFYEPRLESVVRPLEKCVVATGGVVRYPETVYGVHLMKVSFLLLKWWGRGRIADEGVEGWGELLWGGGGKVGWWWGMCTSIGIIRNGIILSQLHSSSLNTATLAVPISSK